MQCVAMKLKFELTKFHGMKTLFHHLPSSNVCVAVYCSALQCVAMCSAVRCSVFDYDYPVICVLQCVLQCGSVWCNMLQCVLQCLLQCI